MLNQIFNNSSEYFQRFSLSFFFSIVLFLLCVFSNHINHDNIESKIFVWIGIIFYNFLFSVGLRLFSESRKKSLLFYYVSVFLAFLLIYFYFSPMFDSIPHNNIRKSPQDFSASLNFILFFFLGAFLFIFTGPFFKKESADDEISTFNYNTLSQMFFAILGSFVLWIGGTALLFSVDSLLKIDVSSKIYFDLFFFSFCLFLPVFFLSGVSRNFNEIKVQYPKSIKYILFYVCIPIIVVFSAIFTLYTVKIIVQNNFRFFSKFFYIFCFYSLIGILTYIIDYPFRNENKMTIFFYKNFFRFLIFPTILSIVMIFPYVIKYGFTELRFFGLIFLIWICMSIIVKFSSKQNAIKNILLSTTLFAFLLSVSPLNFINVPEISQVHILKKILKENDLLVDEKLQKSNIEISEKDARRIKDISKYLIQSRMTKSLQELVGDKIDIENEIRKKDHWFLEDSQEKFFNILTSKEEKK
jgi:hypothetical protein